MRRIVGVFAVLGFAAVVVNAQPPRERAVTFKPPQPLQPGEPGIVARGAADDFPPSSFLPSTPVKRGTEPARAPIAGSSPLWLNGVDPNVIPAAGTAGKSNAVRPLSPTPTNNPQPKDEPVFSVKNIEKFKNNLVGNDKSKAPTAQPPAPPEQPTAVTPFRGTSASGAPVYAGPPAYRWYGWGSVTPGANTFAPNGVYPKASANWYSITGATPGAFPVPVMNPLRSPPGTEPPTYGMARVNPQPQPVVPVSTQPQPQQQSPVSPWPQPQPQPRPATAEPSKFSPTGTSKFVPTPSVQPPAAQPTPVSVPKLTPPPVTTPVISTPPVLPPVPVTVKQAAPISIPALTPAPKPEMIATQDAPKPLPFVPSVVPPEVPSREPAKLEAMTPNPLPIAVIEDPKREVTKQPELKPEEPKQPEPKREEYRWQTAPEPTQPAPGTWTPAGGTQPKPLEVVPTWKSGEVNTKPIVVRAQMADNDKDPVAALIQQVCHGRASDLEVRWAGTKKLYVCFEIRTADEARKLVTDISKRPELSPYQIDFCVVVK